MARHGLSCRLQGSCPITIFPEFVASSAYAKSGPRLRRFRAFRGVFIKLQAALQSFPPPSPNPDTAKGTATNSGKTVKDESRGKASRPDEPGSESWNPVNFGGVLWLSHRIF